MSTQLASRFPFLEGLWHRFVKGILFYLAFDIFTVAVVAAGKCFLNIVHSALALAALRFLAQILIGASRWRQMRPGTPEVAKLTVLGAVLHFFTLMTSFVALGDCKLDAGLFICLFFMWPPIELALRITVFGEKLNRIECLSVLICAIAVFFISGAKVSAFASLGVAPALACALCGAANRLVNRELQRQGENPLDTVAKTGLLAFLACVALLLIRDGHAPANSTSVTFDSSLLTTVALIIVLAGLQALFQAHAAKDSYKRMAFLAYCQVSMGQLTNSLVFGSQLHGTEGFGTLIMLAGATLPKMAAALSTWYRGRASHAPLAFTLPGPALPVWVLPN
jgi:drug/metabolite transporter (DMT)-like permease